MAEQYKKRTRGKTGGKLGADTVDSAREMLNGAGLLVGVFGVFEQAANGAASAMKKTAAAAAKTARATAKAAGNAARYAASFDEIERLGTATKSGGATSAGGSAGGGGSGNGSAGGKSGSLLKGMGVALAAFWTDFTGWLAPAVAAWMMAWDRLQEKAGGTFRQLSTAADGLWNGTLAPMGQWLGQVFAPQAADSFAQAFAPIASDVTGAAVQSFATLFTAACGAVAAVVQTVLMPALALILQVWQGLMLGIQNAWSSWGQPILTGVQQAIQGLVTLAAAVWTSVLQPVLQQLMADLQALWTQHLQPLWEQLTQLFGAVTTLVLGWWNDVLLPFYQWLTVTFGPTVGTLFSGVGDAVLGAVGVMASAVDTALRLFQGLAEFLTNVFAGNWQAAWDAVRAAVSDAWAGIQNTVHSAVNVVIGFVNSLLRAVASGVNAIAGALNALSFDVPSWVPGIGGSHLGFSFPTVSAPQIPMLASGGVIRQPTLAMMGEYPGAGSDPEIAAPQSAMAQAMSDANGEVVDAVLTAAQQIIEAIRENGGGVVIGDEVIGRAVRRYNNRQAVITGGAVY